MTSKHKSHSSIRSFVDVDFYDDGTIGISVFDLGLCYKVDKLIDRTGKEKFHSEYSCIFKMKKGYQVKITKGDTELYGYVDANGTVILPCDHVIPIGGIDEDKRRFVFESDGKQGIKDFDGHIVIPPIYTTIAGFKDKFLKVETGKGQSALYGLLSQEGKIVLPIAYTAINAGSGPYILAEKDHEWIAMQLKGENI